MSNIPESDWKKLRKIKDSLLNEACENIFTKVEKLIHNRSGNEHAIYLKLWKLIDVENNKIASMFDDLKRSNAFVKIANIKRNNV